MDLLSYIRNQWDRVGAWVSIAAGALALLLGWLGVSGTAFPAEQIPYIVSGGLVGVFLLGVGAVLWLSADLRDEWRKLDRIEEALFAGRAPADDAATSGNGTTTPAPTRPVRAVRRRATTTDV